MLFSYDRTQNKFFLSGMEQPSIVVKDCLQVHLDFINTSCELTRSVKIWGQIVNEHGQPIPYLLLSLYRRLNCDGDYQFVNATYTNEDGMYIFEVEYPKPPVYYTLMPCVNQSSIHYEKDSTSPCIHEVSHDTNSNTSSILYIAQNKPLE